MESIWSDEVLLHIIKGKITCSWHTNHLQQAELCCIIMALCGMDIIYLWSTVSIFYVKDKIDSCPGKRQFDFWLSAIFGGCPLTFILTKDEDWSTEYTGVSPFDNVPCSMEVIPACNVDTFNWTYIQFIACFSAIYRACVRNREGWLLKYSYLTCMCLNRKKQCLHGIVAGSE